MLHQLGEALAHSWEAERPLLHREQSWRQTSQLLVHAGAEIC